MRKRNKKSEEKKWWIMENWRCRNNPPVKQQPVMSSGIFLRDTTYTIDTTDYRLRGIQNIQEGKVGPIDIWKMDKPYVRTIESRRKSWPMYTIEDGKFKTYEWPKKAKLKINRNTNRSI